MRNFRLGFVCLLTALLVVFVAGCGQETVTIPSVVSVTPAQGAANVAVNTAITATFSQAMNPASITAATFTVAAQGGAAVTGTVAYTGTVATFTPGAALAYGTTYTATITTGASTPGGAELIGPYVWSFTTAAPTIPAVTLVTPAQGATNVAINAPITATFSIPMSPASVNGATTFTVYAPGGVAVAGSAVLNGAGTLATFTPTSGTLAKNTSYTATITTAATSVGGYPIVANYVWSFTTVAAAPIVVATVPANGALNVSIGQVLSATFSEAMTPASISTTTFTLSNGGVAVPGTVTYSGQVATFTPKANLAYSTTYKATITTGATSMAGIPLAANYSWTFKTITPAPTVTAVVPLNGATAVPVAQVLSATFSEAMIPGTLNAATFTVLGPGGVAVPGAVTYSGLVATFTPTANLAPSSFYVATITIGAEDLAGTPLATNYVWTFTTFSPALAVTATVPVNTATGVPVDQVLSATFNEPMNCTPFPAAAFTVTGPGATPVPGTISCAGDVATFTPAANLPFNTLFTATITTGAKDLAGDSLASNYVWTFLTVPAPTVPTVISTVPVSGATAVPTNQALTATFSEAMSPASINSATFLLTVKGGASVTGVVTYVAAGSVATFTPDANLAPDTVYTATITTGATALDGAALAQNYPWSFTTAALPIVIPPTVISTIPVTPNPTAVPPVPEDVTVPPTQIVSAAFSTAMNPATITTITPPTFTLTYVPTAGGAITPVAGLVAYAAVGNTLTFTPAAALPPSTTFTATITTAAQDLAGIGLASNYVWTFATSAAVVVVPPELVSTVPASAATGVPLNQAVSATFSEAMNPLTLTSATFLLYQGSSASGTPIGGTYSYDPVNFIATFTPTAPLTASTSYTATVTNGATDLAGDPLGNTGAPNPWTFTTAATPPPPPPIVLGPTISLFGAFGGNAGITNQGLFTVVNADIGTTAASTLITGFHDDSVISSTGVPQCTYTESTAPPATGLVGAASATSPGTGVIAIFTAPGTSQPTSGCPDEASGPATLPGTTAYIAQQAASEALTAYNTLQCSCNPAAGTTPTGVIGASLPSNLGGLTLAPGTWTNATTVGITGGDLTLDAGGDPNAYWIFQIGSTLTVGDATSPQSVKIINGGNAANVYWAVGSAATINYGGGGTMVGTIISTAATTLSSPAQSTTTSATTFLTGRALALNASTTMVNTIINLP